jgi:hypothetical protein
MKAGHGCTIALAAACVVLWNCGGRTGSDLDRIRQGRLRLIRRRAFRWQKGAMRRAQKKGPDRAMELDRSHVFIASVGVPGKR